jgi:hypothetical protein
MLENGIWKKAMHQTRDFRPSPPERRRRAGYQRRLALVLVACVAAGCQSLTPEWQSRAIDPGDSAIRFEHAGFDPKLAEYMVQRDPRSANAVYVARFTGADAFAVVAAVKTGPSYVVEERATEAYVSDLLENVKPDWGASGRVAAPIGIVPYRMFRLPGQSASCVGFAQQVGQPADDRNRRKGVAFGYFCQDETRPMSTEAAEDLIGKVSLGGRR